MLVHGQEKTTEVQLIEERFDLIAAGHRLSALRIVPDGTILDPDRPILVFLHEGLGSIAQWRDFPHALVRETGLPALVYERWGFGTSDPLDLPRPVDYLRQEAEESLPEVLQAAGVKRPVIVGHSDGGSIALYFAAAFPEMPVAVITEAAHVFVEEVTLEGIRAALKGWDEGWLRKGLEKYHGANTEGAFLGWAETWLRPPFPDWNMEDRLPSIVAPLLVMQGEGDQYGSEKQVDAIVHQVSGFAIKAMLPDCQHVPHHEAREAVLNQMANFIRERVWMHLGP